MNRINVYDYPAGWDEDASVTLAGWFDMEKAQKWSDADSNGDGSGGTGRGQAIVRTAQGRWVLCNWTRYQGDANTYQYTTAEDAREWLLREGYDDAVTEHFGEIPEEEDRRGGRPAIGGEVNVRLGDDLLAMIDDHATQRGISRAEALRRLAQDAVTRARVADSGPLTSAVNR